MASLAAPTITLRRYPGWYFGIAEAKPKDKLTFLRIAIWHYCHQHQLTQPLVMEWYDKLRIHAYLGNDISRLLFIDGYYEPNEFVLLASILKPGMTFLDIGANDGLYSLFASQYVGSSGQVLAFEPSQREFRRLQDNIHLNGLANIKPRQIGLYNVNGNLAFQIAGYEHEGQNTLGGFIYNGVNPEKVENVIVRRLDDLVIEEQLDRIDVIKMDVEGAEHAVLEGAHNLLQKQKPIILLELSDNALQKQGSSAAETLSFLRSLGYDIYSFNKINGQLTKSPDDTNLSDNVVASASPLI